MEAHRQWTEREKWYMRPILNMILVVLLGARLAFSQTPQFAPAKPGVITHYVTKGDKVLSTHTIDLNEDVRLIVQFQHPPLSVNRSQSKTKGQSTPILTESLRASITAEHSQ